VQRPVVANDARDNDNRRTEKGSKAKENKQASDARYSAAGL
jgi:hypothetical protein